MYLGGNGFYWRVAFAADRPGVMEVRRAEDGTRAWISEPGESYHELGGEYGGLWRRLGRPPNAVVGIGFAAQGFDRATSYRRTAASYGRRTAWIFEGVEGEEIGAKGVGGGAAGQEIDRYDRSLGSPRHAVVVATATDHSPEMLRTKEELHATVVPGPDPDVRADVVFFEVPGGGAVFSVGSISWYGALHGAGPSSEGDGGTDIGRITANVLARFRDPEPFAPPG
jgi:N,N-dimethylformamidase